MNQIKYLVSAFLLLFALVTIAFFIATFFSVVLIAKRPAVVDYIEPAKSAATVSSPGKILFSTNCATCHALDKVLTGPALRGVESRGPWTDRKNIIKWVKNSAATIKRFEYTKQLAAQFGGQIMPSFSNLTDREIGAILDYIRQAPAYSYNNVVATK